MRKFTIGGLAIALALILGLDTPRPVAAQLRFNTTGSVTDCKKFLDFTWPTDNPKPHLIFLIAGRKVCVDTNGDLLAALFYVKNFRVPIDAKIQKNIDEYNSYFENPQGIKEPGLLGMAETLLREMLSAQAKALLPALAAEKEIIRLAEQERLARDLVYQEKKKKYDECIASNAAAVPDPVTGAMTLEMCTNPDQGTVVLRGGTSTSLVVTRPTKECTPKTTSSGPVEVYVETIINVLCHNPDQAVGVKLWLYEVLKRIAGPAGAKTPGEKEFLGNMIRYVREQNIKVAQEALDAYDRWKIKGSYIPPSIGAASTVYLGEIPPDFDALATQKIMAGAAAAAVYGALVGSISAAVVVGASSGSLAALMGGAVISTATSATMAAAAATGPVAIALAALAMAGYGAYTIIKINEARPNLEEALAKAKKYPLLGRMLNAPGTVSLVQYYFAKATSKYSPTGLKDSRAGCQVCLYEDTNFRGKKFCTSGRETNLELRKIEGDRYFHWSDEISSFQLDITRCKDGFVKLFEDAGFGGDKLIQTRTVSNIGSAWNDKISSLEFVNKNAPQCEVCFYKGKSYSEGMFCAQGPIPDLRPLDLSDEFSSVMFQIRSCPKAKVWLYEDENYQGQSIPMSKSHENFRTLTSGKAGQKSEWDDDVTSIYFSPDGKNPYWGRQFGGCRVCLYASTYYEGSWKCVNGNDKNFDLSKGEFDLDDMATSIDFVNTDCPKGKSLIATLYDKENHKGSQLYMEESDPNFGRLSRGRSIWNDSVSSLAVGLVDTSVFECRICLYDAAGYQGKKFCTTGLIKDLRDVSFDDITSSIKVFRQTGKIGPDKKCLGGGAWVFKNNNRGGEKWNIKYDDKNIPNVGSKWNDKISSVDYSFTKYTVIDSSLPKAAGPNPWRLVSGGVGSLDISVGAHGLVWVISAQNIPYTWTGTRWSKMGSKKGTRIDASAGGQAWMVGTDKFLYSWDPSKKTWKKQGNKKATDVGVSPSGGIIWIVGGDESDKKPRGFALVNKNKPDAYKVYYYKDYRNYQAIVDNKWTRGGGQNYYGIRVDVDMRGNAWVVGDQDQSGSSGYTGFLPRQDFRVTGTRPSAYGGRRQSDVSIGVGNQVVVAADAPWFLKGTKWVVAHGDGYKSIAVDGRGNLWGITNKDLNNKSYPGSKRKIHAYGNALTRAKEAVKAAAAAAVAKTGQEWHVVSGKALDISAGPDGSVWLIGTDKSPYQWTGKIWFKRSSKKGTRIDVDPKGMAWMVGTDKFLYSWTGGDWMKQGNRQVIDVGVGANGDIWAVGTDGFLYKWTGRAWQKKPAAGKFHRIDVGPKGTPWAVSTQGQVWYWTGGGWIPNFIRVQQYLNSPAGKASFNPYAPMPVPDLPANDISVGVNGKVWIAVKVGGTAELIGPKGWMRNSPNVKPVGIAVDKNGNRWVISDKNTIHTVRDASRVKPPVPLFVTNVAPATAVGPAPTAPPRAAAKTWKTMAGKALDISVGSGGSVWAIDPDHSPKFWTGTRWTKITGKGTRIDVGAGGLVWLVGTDKRPYYWKNNRWNVSQTTARFTDIGVGANGQVWAVGTDKRPYYLQSNNIWTVKPSNAVRIDVDANGNAWALTIQGNVLTGTGKSQWKKLPKDPPPANDISVGANGTIWVALKGGGTATWNGKAWSKTGPGAKSTSVAVNQNGAPLVTTDKQEIRVYR